MNGQLCTHEDLKKIFEIEKDASRYERYTPLRDSKIGFSIQRKYPKEIRYKPPVKEDGAPDVFALIHIFCDDLNESVNAQDSKRLIVLRITPHSRYLANHWDYNFGDKEGCPTRESVEFSKQTPKPIPLESTDEYFYDFIQQSLITKDNKRVSGDEVLEKFFRQHCDTIHFFKGLRIQWKIGSQKLGIKLADVCIQTLVWLLKTLTGRTLESKEGVFVGTLKPYQKEDMKLLYTEKINVFNYEASKNIIVTFCCLVVFARTLDFLFDVSCPYIDHITESSTGLLATAILALWMLDHLLPKLVLWFINRLILFKIDLMFRKFKV